MLHMFLDMSGPTLTSTSLTYSLDTEVNGAGFTTSCGLLETLEHLHAGGRILVLPSILTVRGTAWDVSVIEYYNLSV